jgi:4-amino-4-deoxy-L-arabinose transferase-like glycosyltransferase
MKSLNWKPPIFVLVMAVLFRFWGAFDFQGQVGDEEPFLALSRNLMAYGVGDWKYAPMTDLILAGTMQLFGDNPVGWRISGIIFGTGAIILVYMIARRLYTDNSVPLLAAAFLAFDPFHIHFSRTITQEMPVIFFFLAFLYLLLEQSENNRHTLTSAGVALGLTIATKVYFVFAIPLAALYAFSRARQLHQQKSMLLFIEFIIKLVLLPLAIYLLAHVFWFGRGHTLPELFQLKSDAFWVFNHNFVFDNAQLLLQGGKPWEWFLKPFSFGHQLSPDGQYANFALQINNPLFRIMVLPAMAIVSYQAAKTRRIQEALAPLLFAACYLIPLLAKRPMNSYSALVLLPFAYIALARAVVILADKYSCKAEATLLFLCAIIVSGCYLFPIATGFRVPVGLYKPVLSISAVTKVF